jgi:glutamine synthetase
MKTTVEYIWVGGKGELRSKTRVLDLATAPTVDLLPDWNYDGSSTEQVVEGSLNTEVVIKPRFMVKNPLLSWSYLVLCDTYDIDGTPITTNTRFAAAEIFQKNPENEPWFGLEQEYFMWKEDWPCLTDQGRYYCGTSLSNVERKITDEHLTACLAAGIKLSGINAEVAPYQWEFQVGPCVGIEAGDHMYLARFLLERIAEKYDVRISYDPKPSQLLNGSGCHTNFSTRKIREPGGLEEIYKCMERLAKTHAEHLDCYGKGNRQRLTGKHETASYDRFSFGVGTRNTSVRIPNQTYNDKCGYFEDRRPAANMDPYLVTSKLYKTCCLYTFAF